MPGQGTKIPHALWRSQKKEKKRKKETKRKNDQKSEASSENQKTMRGTGSVHMGMCIWGGEWNMIALFNYLKAYVEKSYSAFLRPTLDRICGRTLRQMEGYSQNIPFASHLLQPLQLGRTM